MKDKKKTKWLTVRMTNNEYETLIERAQILGYKSISEYTRKLLSSDETACNVNPAQLVAIIQKINKLELVIGKSAALEELKLEVNKLWLK